MESSTVKPLSDLDKKVRAGNLDRLRERLSQTSSQANTTLELSPLALERIKALENYPQLKDKVRITNEGIVVETTAGELKFRFNHTEGGQTFENAHKPYSREQLEALIQIFGSKPAPYLDILGLKNTHTDKGKLYNYNFYWSSSAHDNYRFNAWGFFLDASGVAVGYGGRDSRGSAFSL